MLVRLIDWRDRHSPRFETPCGSGVKAAFEEIDKGPRFRGRGAIDRERCLYFSAKAENSLWDARFHPNSCLVFGNETAGMPDRIIEKHPERCFRIPMLASEKRSSNPD